MNNETISKLRGDRDAPARITSVDLGEVAEHHVKGESTLAVNANE